MLKSFGLKWWLVLGFEYFVVNSTSKKKLWLFGTNFNWIGILLFSCLLHPKCVVVSNKIEFYIIYNSDVVVYLEHMRLRYCLMHWSSVFNDIFLSCILLPSEIYKKFTFWYKNLKVIGKSKKLVLWLNIQIMQKANMHIKWRKLRIMKVLVCTMHFYLLWESCNLLSVTWLLWYFVGNMINS